MRGVITADVVGSTRIPDEARDLLPKRILELSDELNAICRLKTEIYRGDSFQIVVEDASLAMKIAVLFRAGLRMTPLISSRKSMDARLSVGIGEISYDADNISQSDGSAFVNSGREFDNLKRRRLSIVTPVKQINDELQVSTAFLDDVISHWSVSQSEVMYRSLLMNEKQVVLAEHFSTSQQNIAKRLSSAKENLVRMYLSRVEDLISKQL